MGFLFVAAFGHAGHGFTVLQGLTGRRLPGRFGDAVFITPERLAELYARHGFTLRTHTPSPTFLGLPVFIYHSVERVGD